MTRTHPLTPATAALPAEPPDLLGRLADLEDSHPLAALRRSRPAVLEAIQTCRQSLFDPPAAPGLSPTDLDLAALRVAALQQAPLLADHHRERARARGAHPDVLEIVQASPAFGGDGDRLATLLGFVDRLTLKPAAATPEHLAELQSWGFGSAAVVTLAQAVSFVNFELRVLAGLQSLAAAGPAPVQDAGAASGDLIAGQNRLAATPPSHGHFTINVLGWRAWLPTVDVAHATPAQLAVLDESNAAARGSAYYLTLVHNPDVLRERSRLFNAIMQGPGGLPRAERELSTVAVSRINGCPYCASVHARLFAQLSKEPQVVESILEQGVNAPLSRRRRAIVDLSVDLTANPPQVAPWRIASMRHAGLDDGEILDVVHAAALFAWANRLMQTLGEPV